MQSLCYPTGVSVLAGQSKHLVVRMRGRDDHFPRDPTWVDARCMHDAEGIHALDDGAFFSYEKIDGVRGLVGHSSCWQCPDVCTCEFVSVHGTRTADGSLTAADVGAPPQLRRQHATSAVPGAVVYAPRGSFESRAA